MEFFPLFLIVLKLLLFVFLSDYVTALDEGEKNSKESSVGWIGDAELEQLRQRDQDKLHAQIIKMMQHLNLGKDDSMTRDQLKQLIIKTAKKLAEDRSKKEFSQYDLNKDKKIVKREALQQYYEKDLSEIEKEKTPQLVAEYEKIKNISTFKFDLADVDPKNGELNMSEFVAYTNPNSYPHMVKYTVHIHLENHDHDRDGRISYAEHEELEKHRRVNEVHYEEDFTKFDANNNQFLEGAEIEAWLRPGYDHLADEETQMLFDKLDQNYDDKLSEQEIKAKPDEWAKSIALHTFQDEL